MTIIESTGGCYEVQDVEFGKVYKWCPENVVAECDCGERLALTRLETTCERCGTDHAAMVHEALADQRMGDENVHPWRYARDREEAGLPC